MSNLIAQRTFTVLMLLSLLVLAGCNDSGSYKSKELELKEKELALKEKELESKQKSSKDGDSTKAGKSDDSDQAETTKKLEKTNPAIVTGEQVTGTWTKGESEIKILALGDRKLKVSFFIFNERNSRSGSADGVANIEGIDATFSPVVDGAENKCKFTMKFTGGKLIVEQFGSDVDCGFGAGVGADGTYTKKNSAKPTFESR